VTLDAVLKVVNTFLQVLCPHIVRPVFVASVAGIATIVAARVTRHAFGVVIPIQCEQFGMVKCGRLPAFLTVAPLAAARDLAVQAVGRRFVATLTTLECGLVQQCMVERGGLPAFRFVTLPATHTEISMLIVRGRGVASLAPLPDRWAKQRMRERFAAALGKLGCLVIAVAGHAVLLDQSLMERGFSNRLFKWSALGRAHSDVGQEVAFDAPLGGCAA